jgi:hypothetical protein
LRPSTYGGDLGDSPDHQARRALKDAIDGPVQRADAVRLYGPRAVWKDVGQHLLDDGCRHRTGFHEEDGCWPDFAGPRR